MEVSKFDMHIEDFYIDWMKYLNGYYNPNNIFVGNLIISTMVGYFDIGPPLFQCPYCGANRYSEKMNKTTRCYIFKV